jgi:transposase
MSERLSKKEYEVYRKKAVELYEKQHLTQTQIATVLGVAQSAVCNWIKRSRSGKPEWHLNQKGSGAKARVTDEQFQVVLKELEKGATAHGFQREYWTAARVGKVIERLYKVKYSSDHIGRKLRKAKWSFKNPLLKARQQSTPKVAEWKYARLPALKKSVG